MMTPKQLLEHFRQITGCTTNYQVNKKFGIASSSTCNWEKKRNPMGMLTQTLFRVIAATNHVVTDKQREEVQNILNSQDYHSLSVGMAEERRQSAHQT